MPNHVVRPVASPPRWLAIPLLIGLGFVSSPDAPAATPKVPDGFQIRLVAAVPAVQFPCQVATRPDGGLFVAEDPMDQIGPADKPIDRILLFRQGGQGEEPVVFAETLNAVFGMVWHEGALYVMNMPNLTVLRDTDGDGKADQREELFTNLGLPAGQPNNFNDHIVSGLQIGIDNYLYVSIGDKGVPRCTGKDGRTVSLRGGGIVRCRLDGTGLELFSSGTRNHLEPNLDAADNLFTYDNTDDGLGWWTRVTHQIDGGYYGYPWDYHGRTDRMLNRMAEYGGGSPCGGLVYREDAWPEKYRGRAFWTEWAKRVVRAFRFDPNGASFQVGDVEDFILPDQVGDFRPLDLALSHDGRTLYVADWGYGGWNNKTEKLGRVYAVTYHGPPIAVQPRGRDTDPRAQQFQALSHPSFNERFRAQRALTREGHAALGDVQAALAAATTPALAKRHLVWVLDGIAGGTPEATLPLIQALNDPTADVRAQAARALGERAATFASDALVQRLADSAATVRLQALIALGRAGDPKCLDALIPVVADSDPYLAFAARRAIQRIADWPATTAIGLNSSDPNVRAGTMLALELVYDTDVVRALHQFAANLKNDPKERARALFLMAQGHRKPVVWDGSWWGTQPARSDPPRKAIDWAGTPIVLASVRARLRDEAPVVRQAAVRAVIDERDREALTILRERYPVETDPDVKLELTRAFGALSDRDALPLLVATLKDTTAADVLRDAALGSVEALGDDKALAALLDLLRANVLGTERMPRVVAALGRFRSKEAVKVLLATLKHESPAARAAAAGALANTGSTAEVGETLRKGLDDPAVEVRKAAIVALGSRRDRAAIPPLLEAASKSDTRFESIRALAEMPDVRAVGVLLQGLADRSPDLRRAASRALGQIRDEAAPLLEQLATRRELPSSTIPELRRIYTRLRPVQTWNVLGPVPIATAPPFALGSAVDLRATYPGFGDRPLAWRTARAVDGRGQIDLGRVFRHDDDLAAFAFAEIDSPSERKAELAVGSDDTITVWVNGEKVFDFQDRRGFSPAENQFDVPLNAGKNRVVVKCGNRGGPWQFSLAVAYPSDYAFLKAPGAGGAFDPESFRAFALKAKGRPERGKALFTDLKGLACARCHAVAGTGGTVGPELTSVGAKYPRDEIIASVLYPSAKISSGYEPVVLATDDGQVLTGVVKGENPDSIEIETAEAKRVRLPKSRIEERKQSDVSIMPNGLAEGLTPQDFTDLIAYLETLKDAGATAKPLGQPD